MADNMNAAPAPINNDKETKKALRKAKRQERKERLSEWY